MSMAKKAIGIVDYGAGNLRSLTNSLEFIGVNSSLFTSDSHPDDFSHLVLPGVGAFDAALNNLKKNDLLDKLELFRSSGKPVLGVCLGMQMLCSSSEEGNQNGLSWIKAKVESLSKLDNIDKVPHMGWNEIEIVRDHPVFSGIKTGSDVYFVHSYGVINDYDGITLAETNCGNHFASIIASDNIVGMQFHPEKSQNIGLKLLKNFCEWNV